MSNPTLLIIAGCNGSGKSSFSKALSPENTSPYDYDLVFLDKYNSLIDSELRDRMAHNLSSENLRTSIENAIANRESFCYETNFNSTPLYWPTIFKQENYRLELAFFCLDSIDKAKERVRIRVENGGHFVPDAEIEERYRLGYKHLNENWKFFDSIHLFETSQYDHQPKHILTIEQKELIILEEFPEYLNKLIPDIADRVK
jgi:predicted ABC-type ATPase